jgi:CRISPR-associated protein Csy3
MTKNKSNLASVLAFEKKIVPSDGYMYGTSWADKESLETPIPLIEKSVRGTISNRLKDNIAKDPVKIDAEVEKANLQTVDSASLPLDQDTLKLVFTLKFLPGVETPSACNNETHMESIRTMCSDYIEATHFKELSLRYAYNIANGRFLWRNRVGAEKIEIHVALPDGTKSWKFNSYHFSMKDFSLDNGKITESEKNDLLELAELIADTLCGEREYLLIRVTAFDKIGSGQDVYPSEELILDKGPSKKSKILYEVDGTAAMHSQKIGNAIRTIDTWYGEGESSPIAVDPYGAVTNLGTALRKPNRNKGKDFYNLFDTWSTGGEIEDTDKDFVMAVLVRGGVFGKSGKDE